MTDEKNSSTDNIDDGVPAVLPWHRQLLAIKDTIITILTPIIFLPVFAFSTSRAARCGYGALIVAVYWMTECLPMAVTAMLPVPFMTWFGVMDSREICKNYMKDANFLFVGGLLVTIAVEKSGLHKRVALRILMLVGSKPVWIIFGFMAVTGFLSMWLANIQTCAMMIPIAAAVLDELNAHRKNVRETKRRQRLGLEMKPMNDDDDTQPLDGVTRNRSSIAREEAAGLRENSADEKEWTKIYQREDEEFRKFSCALKLSVAYATSIGGTATLIGCEPHIVFKGQVEQVFGPDTGINFFSFLVFAFPHMIVILLIGWLSLVTVFIGLKKAAFSKNESEDENGDSSAAAVIRREYAKLSRMTWAEAWVLGCFIVLALMWITKQPQFVPGWQALMPNRFVTDSVVAMTICMALFILPSKKPNYLCFRKKTDTTPPAPSPPLLDWPTVNAKMQWGVILLTGGGFAIADACRASSLSSGISEVLASFRHLPPALTVFLVSVLATCMTTFIADVAAANLLVPIVAELAVSIEIHPIYLVLPVVIAVSFSYLLPVSTPVNAIVYARGDITVPDMLKVGIFNCIVHVATLQLAINSYGYAFFDLGSYPDWTKTRAGLMSGLSENNGTMWNTTLSQALLSTTPAHDLINRSLTMTATVRTSL